MRWGVEKRLEFIEFRLFWEGGINRADIMETFGVSVPQASKDLSLYEEKAPGNLAYDRSEKRYFAASTYAGLLQTRSLPHLSPGLTGSSPLGLICGELAVCCPRL